MVSAKEYIDDLQAAGRSTFTTAQAVKALGVSVIAARAAVRRLKRKGLVADPYRGFHVVVPPQYRRLGCRPADQFLPQLMKHLGEPYYVGLLSAARYHGAGHQAPMVFQVMVGKARRSLECGEVHVDFVVRQGLERTTVVERNTETGTVRIASSEATALEMVGYPQHCGYFDNIATVLAELSEVMDGPALATEAQKAPISWVQRLGYLLELVQADELARSVDDVLQEANTFPVALAPWENRRGAPRNARWNVAVNLEVEPDL